MTSSNQLGVKLSPSLRTVRVVELVIVRGRNVRGEPPIDKGSLFSMLSIKRPVRGLLEHYRHSLEQPPAPLCGEPPGTRTQNRLIKSQLLYRLS